MNWKRTIFPMLLAMIYSQQAIAGEPIIKNSDAKYSIQMTDLTMTIDSKGGKILSFKYKDAEVISQIRFPEAFGSTFWTSPQKEWNWPPVPEYDNQP